MVTSSASRAHLATCSRTGSTFSETWSASRMKSRMTVFCLRRIAIVSLVSRSAGWARRMTSFRSSGRPARPVPSSERISRKRSL